MNDAELIMLSELSKKSGGCGEAYRYVRQIPKLVEEILKLRGEISKLKKQSEAL